jgi:hypothetical protein
MATFVGQAEPKKEAVVPRSAVTVTGIRWNTLGMEQSASPFP